MKNSGAKIITTMTLRLTRAHGSVRKAAQQHRTPKALRAKTFVFIRVHSWLESKSQHFDCGRNLDVLVAYNEIQRGGGTWLSSSCLPALRRR
jgi:hypothetical protein